MSDLLDKLHGLKKQATVERSHYYVGSVVGEAINELERLYAIEALAGELLERVKKKNK